MNSKKLDVNSTDETGRVALQVAIEARQVESVKILLDHDADVNSPVIAHQSSLLGLAIERGNCKVVELLLNG